MYGQPHFIAVTNRRGDRVHVNVRNILTVTVARFNGDDLLYGNITTERGCVITKQMPEEIMKLIEKGV